MKQPSAEEFPEGDPLSSIQQRLEAGEMELRLIALDLETNAAVETLSEHHGWKLLTGNIQKIIEQETDRLLTARMDGYALGLRQGFVRALRVLKRTTVLSQQEIANLKQRVSLLVDRNQTDKQLLS